ISSHPRHQPTGGVRDRNRGPYISADAWPHRHRTPMSLSHRSPLRPHDRRFREPRTLHGTNRSDTVACRRNWSRPSLPSKSSSPPEVVRHRFGCHGYRSEQGAESGFTQIRSIRSHLLSIFILEYRQTKWSRGFSHRSEPRIEISIELDDDVGRLSDSGGRKAAQRSGSVRSIPDSSS